MAGWYQLGNNDFIFAYGKTGSTFMNGLHNAGKITRPKFNNVNPAETMPGGILGELQTLPVRSPKDITISFVVRHPKDRFVSALFMIMNHMFSQVLFKGKFYSENADAFNKSWTDEDWWANSISGFLASQGIGNLERKKNYSRMLDRLDKLDSANGCVGLRGEEFDLFKFIFLDPDHEYHLGNYLHNILKYKDYPVNIVELDSLDYFLNSRAIDATGIFKYTRAESPDIEKDQKEINKQRYSAFKSGFNKNEHYALVYDYLISDIHVYNNLINFGYDNIQKVYIDNKEMICPT